MIINLISSVCLQLLYKTSDGSDNMRNQFVGSNNRSSIIWMEVRDMNKGGGSIVYVCVRTHQMRVYSTDACSPLPCSQIPCGSIVTIITSPSYSQTILSCSSDVSKYDI